MSDRLALANAIEDAGIERSKAERVASVIVAAIYDHAATKVDVQASETAVRADIAQLAANTRADLAQLTATTRAEIADLRGSMQAGEAAMKAEISAQAGSLRAELKSGMAGVRSVLASEVARLDTRIERLDAAVKAQPNAITLRLGTLMVVLTGLLLVALRYLPLPHG